MSHQGLEQHELTWRELHLSPTDAHLAGHHVDRDAPLRDRGRLRLVGGPQSRPDASEEFGEAAGSRDVVVRPAIKVATRSGIASLAVSTITGTDEPAARSLVRISSPVTVGSTRSRTTRSKSGDFDSFRPSAPSHAVWTTNPSASSPR